MKIVILSGGSGQRLWPLSNNARSKQFLKVLSRPDGGKESMIQRIVRQIRENDIKDEILVATASSQKDAIENQLKGLTSVVTEPDRRNTFPAILLAAAYLKKQGTSDDEPIIVIPCDSFSGNEYFATLKKMAESISRDLADLVYMGITPTYPSAKYGYIVPESSGADDVAAVKRFTEKPSVENAELLIKEGALWNGGVFGFKLGYIMQIANRIIPNANYDTINEQFQNIPKISFDYAVAEKERSAIVIPYSGEWKDLGTWNTLTDELKDWSHGNVKEEECENTYIINELEVPMICIGAKGLVIAASPDGILVSDRKKSENLKHLVSDLGNRPMYEERRWGEYKVVDNVEFKDGYCALTKQLTLRPGCNISYQRHTYRDEVWTFIDGEGEIVLNGERKPVKRGDVIIIPKGQMHALRAITSLTFIEVQSGNNLVEEDIERFEYEWGKGINN